MPLIVWEENIFSGIFFRIWNYVKGLDLAMPAALRTSLVKSYAHAQKHIFQKQTQQQTQI